MTTRVYKKESVLLNKSQIAVHNERLFASN